MLTYLRYALATFCFAASVGCLALWWRSNTFPKCLVLTSVYMPSTALHLDAYRGAGIVALRRHRTDPEGKIIESPSPYRQAILRYAIVKAESGRFSVYNRTILFPLWYPALIFALAGIAALRLGRRFTLRSALVATTVVAGLLGMAVAL
jgi:hypothetical protein